MPRPPPPPTYSGQVRRGGVADGLDGRWRDVMPPVYAVRAHVRVADVMTAVSGRGAHVPMQGQVKVTLQVMRLLQKVVRVKALLV